jgi:hypothetical protein
MNLPHTPAQLQPLTRMPIHEEGKEGLAPDAQQATDADSEPKVIPENPKYCLVQVTVTGASKSQGSLGLSLESSQRIHRSTNPACG